MPAQLSYAIKKKRGLFSKGLNSRELFGELEQMPLGNGAKVKVTSKTELIVQLCPLGNLTVRIEDGQAHGDINAMVSGPGAYHAAVHVIERLSSSVGGDLEVQDASQYWHTRDFERLQSQFVALYQDLINQIVSKSDDQKNIFVSRDPSIPWIPVGFSGVSTPMGVFPFEFFKHVLEQNAVESFLKDYLVWFNREPDALFHRGVAIYKMWNECCWVPPRDEEEAKLQTSILEHLKMARQLDMDLPLPIEAWADLAQLCGQSQTANGPQMLTENEIGYLRRDVIWHIAGGWAVTLPGHLKEYKAGLKAAQAAFWDLGNRAVHITSRKSSGGDFSKEGVINMAHNGIEATANKMDASVVGNPIQNESDGHLYVGRYTRDARGNMTLSCFVVKGNDMAHVTVSWVEQEGNWMDQARSIVQKVKKLSTNS